MFCIWEKNINILQIIIIIKESANNYYDIFHYKKWKTHHDLLMR